MKHKLTSHRYFTIQIKRFLTDIFSACLQRLYAYELQNTDDVRHFAYFARLDEEYFRSGTDLISLLIWLLVLLFLLGWPLRKSLQGSVVSNRIEMTFGRNVPPVNTHRLTESDLQFDVTLSRWWPWHHFTQQSAATWCMKMNRPSVRPSVPDV